METLWEYDLSINEKSSDYQYESPILIRNDFVFYISMSDKQKSLHLIDVKSGTGNVELLNSKNLCLPSDCFFVDYKDIIILYADDFFVYKHGILFKQMELTKRGIVTAHLLVGNRLILCCNNGRDALLYCYNLDSFSIEWEMNIANSKPYRAGELSFYENRVACYGKDQLLFIDYENGNIDYFIEISRIDKLFCPLKIDDENMLIGYTNWTNAGILKYNFLKKEIVWRHKRKFAGPQLKCKISRQEDTAFWVKNSTELISLSIETGNEIYQVRTTPWLYTDLLFLQDNLIYGTSGADGYINNIETKTGKKRWSVFLKNGCTCFDIYKDSIIVGDFDKTIKQISSVDGTIVQNYSTSGEIVGKIKVFENCVYTVIWGNAEKGARLIKVRI